MDLPQPVGCIPKLVATMITTVIKATILAKLNKAAMVTKVNM
jgi:hypothetical protein